MRREAKFQILHRLSARHRRAGGASLRRRFRSDSRRLAVHQGASALHRCRVELDCRRCSLWRHHFVLDCGNARGAFWQKAHDRCVCRAVSSCDTRCLSFREVPFDDAFWPCPSGNECRVHERRDADVPHRDASGGYARARHRRVPVLPWPWTRRGGNAGDRVKPLDEQLYKLPVDSIYFTTNLRKVGTVRHSLFDLLHD